MGTKQVVNEIEQLEKEIKGKKEKIRSLRKQLRGEPAENYTFLTAEGEEITLLELFVIRRFISKIDYGIQMSKKDLQIV